MTITDIQVTIAIVGILYLAIELRQLRDRIHDLEDANHQKADTVGFVHESEEEEEYE